MYMLPVKTSRRFFYVMTWDICMHIWPKFMTKPNKEQYMTLELFTD